MKLTILAIIAVFRPELPLHDPPGSSQGIILNSPVWNMPHLVQIHKLDCVRYQPLIRETLSSCIKDT